MPFKTRKRKMNAQERRFSVSADGTFSYGAVNEDKKVEIRKPEKRTLSIENSYEYVKKDLLSIGIIAGSIIALQLILKLTPILKIF
jgi:hypothetical protein